MLHVARIFKLIVACLLGALSLACGQVESPTVASATSERPVSSRPSQATSQEVANQVRIRQLIASLSKPDQSEDAQNELLEIAKRSTTNRDRVVQDLIADVKSHERLSGQHLVLGELFYYWECATRIFLRLEATEAIEVMIQCIYCGNGIGRITDTPAFGALQVMGKKQFQNCLRLLVSIQRIVFEVSSLSASEISGDLKQRKLYKTLFGQKLTQT